MIRRYIYIILLAVISVIVQFTIQKNDVDVALINSLFQFVSTWLISFVFNTFYNKYYEGHFVRWWISLYILVIGFTFLDGLFNKIL